MGGRESFTKLYTKKKKLKKAEFRSRIIWIMTEEAEKKRVPGHPGSHYSTYILNFRHLPGWKFSQFIVFTDQSIFESQCAYLWITCFAGFSKCATSHFALGTKQTHLVTFKISKEWQLYAKTLPRHEVNTLNANIGKIPDCVRNILKEFLINFKSWLLHVKMRYPISLEIQKYEILSEKKIYNIA